MDRSKDRIYGWAAIGKAAGVHQNTVRGWYRRNAQKFKDIVHKDPVSNVVSVQLEKLTKFMQMKETGEKMR